MGQLTQPVSTAAHPVRRARSGWRFVPVALGTAAVLAGCGASDHHVQRAAVSSAHQPLAVNQVAATGQTGPQTHAMPRKHVKTHVTPRTHATPRAHVDVRRSSPKRAPHAGVSSAHNPLAVSQAAVTGQTGPGPTGHDPTVRGETAGRRRSDHHATARRDDQDHQRHEHRDDRHVGRAYVGLCDLERVPGPDSDHHVTGKPAVEQRRPPVAASGWPRVRTAACASPRRGHGRSGCVRRREGASMLQHASAHVRFARLFPRSTYRSVW